MNDVRLDPKQIFLEALERSSAESLSHYLDEACGGDSAVRARVEALLRAHGDLGNFLGGPPSLVATTNQVAGEAPGTLIGPYKLLEQIGEGGMGLVYMAEQQQPVRRLVALKLIKPGMDSKQVIARFEAERQALAMMDHPNIARVLDAGTTDTGLPYFVMELVRGIPINEFCDGQRLTVRQRLELFLQVCQAVQHAHQKGIIHRDLKPTNVLVTKADTVPLPKVIDFGIAKALGPALTDHTLHTGFAQLVGTPMYMSPEQAEMNHLGVDTRSDVYSLGVLLYELLTGTPPFDRETLSKAGLDEMRRMIREDDPPRPSQRISTLSAQATAMLSQQRGLDERHFGRVLRGELDWIVMKALEKDRSRRYESASALAADIQRYLSDEPVLACPPTTMYRFQKFARKHKPALATAGAIALCLVLGTTVSAWQAVRATNAEAEATANEQKAIANEEKAQANAARAEEKAREATTQRDEAQRQRDEVKALHEKLAAKEEQLQRTLYAAHMNLARHAWDAGSTTSAIDLLEQHRPKPGETDLRGFEWHYLFRLSHSELLTFRAHARPIHSVAYSPDGKHLASADWGTVKVWDGQTGQEVFSVKGGSAFGDFGKCIDFSRDGKRLAGVAGDGQVKIWDAETGRELLSLTTQHKTGSVAFSPDGRRIACAGWAYKESKLAGAAATLFDAQTGEVVFTQNGALGGVAFSPDGKRLASGEKVWDAETGDELLSLKADEMHYSSSLAYSPNGTRIATASYGDKTVKVWDAQSGENLLTIKGSNGGSVAFSPDGKQLASACGDKTVKVWDAHSGKELLSLRGHEGVRAVDFAPDGKRLVSGGDTVKLWDVQGDRKPLTLTASADHVVGSVAFSPDGKRVAAGSYVGWPWTASEPGQGKVWDAQTGEVLFSLKGHTGSVNAVAFSPDGKRLASLSFNGPIHRKAGQPGEVKLWDALTGRELLSLSHKGLVADHSAGSVTFSPDGKRIAASGGEGGGITGPGKVIVWDTESGQEVLTIDEPVYVWHVAYSPDGNRLAGQTWRVRQGAANEATLKVWDALTGQALLSIDGGGVGRIAFSPDGTRLASGSGVWDSQTGQQLLSLKAQGVSDVVFSPNGKRLATTSDGNAVKVWDAQTGAELLTLPGRGSAAFSASGHLLAIGDDAGAVTIYDATPLPEESPAKDKSP